MNIYLLSKHFPKEEKYSLTDQILRSSRAVCANIAEAYRMRNYENSFIYKLVIADGECSETIVWLEFAKSCSFISEDDFSTNISQCEEVGRLLNTMIRYPKKFQ